jgi:Predicted transcriptional regulator
MKKRKHPTPRTPSPEGILLKNLRVHADITQAELAARMGLSAAMVGYWESGRIRPSTHWINVACDVLSVDDATRKVVLTLREDDWDPEAKILKPRAEKKTTPAVTIPVSVFSDAE